MNDDAKPYLRRKRILLGAALVATGIGLQFGIAATASATENLLQTPAISIPSISVRTPIAQVDTPSVEIRPANDGLVPQVNADVPSVTIETPKPINELPLPVVEIVVPETEVQLPPILPVSSTMPEDHNGEEPQSTDDAIPSIPSADPAPEATVAPEPPPEREPISRNPISDMPMAYLGITGYAVPAPGNAGSVGPLSGAAPWNVLAFHPGEPGILHSGDPVGKIIYEYLLGHDQWSKPPPEQPPMHDLLAQVE